MRLPQTVEHADTRQHAHRVRRLFREHADALVPLRVQHGVHQRHLLRRFQHGAGQGVIQAVEVLGVLVEGVEGGEADPPLLQVRGHRRARRAQDHAGGLLHRLHGVQGQSPGAGAERNDRDRVHACALLSFLDSQTVSTAMSAGDTPGMRDAWPSVAGCWRLSFCRASMRSPEIS